MKKTRLTAAAAALLIAVTAAGTPSAFAKNEGKNDRPAKESAAKASSESSGEGQAKNNSKTKNSSKTQASKQARTASSSAPVWKANWEISDVSFSGNTSALTTAVGLVFHESDNSLRALDASTGKLKWTYKGSAFPAAELKNAVFLIAEDGRLLRIDTKKGKASWTVKTAVENPEEASAVLIKGTLYVSDSSAGIKAFNPANGKRKWTSADAALDLMKTIVRYDDVLVATGQSADESDVIFGIDAENGDLLWKLEGSYDVLTGKDGKLLIRDKSGSAPSFDETPAAEANSVESGDTDVTSEEDAPKTETETEDDAAKGETEPEDDAPKVETAPEDDSAEEANAYLVELAYVDLESGELSPAGRYGPLDSAVSGLENSRTFLQGGTLYSVDEGDKGTTLSSFRLNGDSSKNSAKNDEDAGSWLAGPTGGLLFFQSGTVMTAIKAANGASISFGDLASKVTYGPVVVDQRVYAGLENGEVLAFDAKTGRTLGKLSADGAKINGISVSKSSVVVRTEDKLIGFGISKK
ncbi:outer membrane protein assembly factor BamB family protein [Saccharibacillus kuerlensis]|uniref:Pyrrolo-quinoline quinone repeat domain-containing protein n=1 Tax=Saccharibacillus kuerlensis TaxID=459527 RepID=A0ABQ2L455_9BACL|nr:PQQ-binding-like beta-propeller repeat protein [Saccharibacillus kuerlensis]GGO02183.1 hypothetical protein GCM10010969_25240 [Saccharibacillus kuerlensis]